MPSRSVNGVRLNVEVYACPTAVPPLVLLHGFTGSTATWTTLVPALADTCTTIAIDALGHGASDAPVDPTRYRMPCVVADTLAVLDQLGVEQFALLGYSMGGRMALHLAAAAPTRIAALILESASPGIESADERAARVASDEQLAQLLERKGIAAFVEYWERLPLFASQRALPDHVQQKQRRERLAAHPLGLAASLRGAGTGVQAPLHDHLTTLAMPTLLLVGALDAKFCALALAMHAALPRSELKVVPAVGHAVHLEAPDLFNTHVRSFMRRHLWHP